MSETTERIDTIIEIKSWQNEDTMTEKSMYDALFPLSKVDVVRVFPKEIKVKNCNTIFGTISPETFAKVADEFCYVKALDEHDTMIILQVEYNKMTGEG